MSGVQARGIDPVAPFDLVFSANVIIANECQGKEGDLFFKLEDVPLAHLNHAQNISWIHSHE